METSIMTYQGGAILPVVDVQTALKRYQDMKEFIDGILHDGSDYGIIPGTTKKTLLKPGAEKLDWFFGLKPIPEVITSIEDWTGKDHDGEPFFYYMIRCHLMRNGEEVAAADGSCNSWEKKYRYRNQQRKCPACGKETIIKGKEEYGGGWLCFKNKGGCGAKFKDGDKAIEGQEVGIIKNPDICDLPNTLLKMAEKRALVAATLIGANASEWFTQDMEDFIDGVVTEVSNPAPIQATQQPPAPGNGNPAVAEKPAEMTIEQAEAEMSSTYHKPYGQIDTATLQTAKLGMKKAKNFTADHARKIKAIDVIVAARANGRLVMTAPLDPEDNEWEPDVFAESGEIPFDN